MTPEQWAALYTTAVAKKAIAGTAIPIPGIVGRFISVLAHKLTQFWAKHQATIAPYLQAASIAALDALIAALPDILSINKPGPE